MGDLVVTEFITLDGVMQDPGGAEKASFPRGGWAFEFDRGPDGEAFKFDELMAADVQLLGRVTYQGFAAAWPTMEAGDFGVKMNEMPKVVVSTTLESADWQNSTIARGDVAGLVARLKNEYDGDILVAGSCSLVQSLLAEDLVDRLHLMVFPVVLGEGKRLFADGGPKQAFELVGAERAGDTTTSILKRKR
jgi:dihydrofolate reductase